MWESKQLKPITAKYVSYLPERRWVRPKNTRGDSAMFLLSSFFNPTVHIVPYLGKIFYILAEEI